MKIDVFFWFCLVKKMVFHRKTNFSHVKRWFWSGLPQENHLFAREKLVFWLQNHLLRGKTKKPKKPSFLEKGEGILQKIVFLVLPRKKMVFHRKTNFSHLKDGFGLACLRKTIFLRAKSWFLSPKPSFTRQNQKNQKKTSFLENGEGILKKIVFLVLPRKKIVFLSKKPTFPT